MHIRIGLGLLLIGAGCGEMTAEPIRSASLAITSVDIEAEESSDPYACQVSRVGAGNPDGLYPFVSLGELAYAGTCENALPGALNGCWYTGDSSCEQEGRECGGFIGSTDTATGEYKVSGGQHMLCSYPCVADDQCPAAATGNARPACMHGAEFDPATEGGQCMLRCDSGETCPDGFLCIDPGLAFGASDGSFTPAPKQCVQLHRLSLTGDPWPQ
jgi:hypothetical protein